MATKAELIAENEELLDLHGAHHDERNRLERNMAELSSQYESLDAAYKDLVKRIKTTIIERDDLHLEITRLNQELADRDEADTPPVEDKYVIGTVEPSRRLEGSPVQFYTPCPRNEFDRASSIYDDEGAAMGAISSLMQRGESHIAVNQTFVVAKIVAEATPVLDWGE
jgi:hypothetical protein